MIAKKGKGFDIILITAEYHDDHPLSPSGIISRVLESKGYKIGIIEKPITREDYLKLGAPKLFFGVTSGSIDSMLHNYTPLKKKRSEDPHSNISLMPDRALIVYCNKIREYFKSALIVIGGIEASMRNLRIMIIGTTMFGGVLFLIQGLIYLFMEMEKNKYWRLPKE